MGADSYLPTLETLESRLLLAGDVSAVIVRGALNVVGDTADNAIQIDTDGLAQGQVRVYSLDGTTTVNGQDSVTLEGLTGRVDIRMGDGSDKVVMHGVTGKSLRLDGGAGDNNLQVLSCTFKGSLQVCTLTGTQNIAVKDTHASTMRIGTGGGDSEILVHEPVTKSVNVRNKDGHQVVSLYGNIDGNCDVGSVNVKNGSGDNEFWMEFAKVRGKVSISNRQGNDLLRVDDSSLGSLSFSGGTGNVWANVTKTTFKGSVQLKNTNGVDTVMSDSLQLGGAIKVQLKTTQAGSVEITNCAAAQLQLVTGKADDTVTVKNVNISRTTKVQTNAGSDQVTLGNADTDGTASAFKGTVTVKAGTGDDGIHVGGAFGGKATFDGGTGSDTLEEMPGLSWVKTPWMPNVEDFT